MPREYAHFLHSKTLIEELVTEDIFSEDFSKYFYLGSVSPDSGYYDPLNVLGYQRGEKASQFMHDKFEDNLVSLAKSIIKNLNQSDTDIQTENKKIILAFSLGLISHALLDNFLHPLINDISGDYDDPDLKLRSIARNKHRRLETILDCYLIKSNPMFSLNFREVLQECHLKLNFISNSFLMALVSEGFEDDKILLKGYKFYWNAHGRIVSLFSSALFVNSKFQKYVPLSREIKALYFNVKEDEFSEISRTYSKVSILDTYNEALIKTKSAILRIAKELST